MAKDWSAAKRILRSQKGTANFCLFFATERTHLIAYSDADYPGDSNTRQSASGVVCIYGGAAVSWLSQLQKSVSLSTMEAVIIAVNEATKEVIWLTRMCKEITEFNTELL
jgi:hypothetical protein